MADIEQADTRNVGKVREHLARALRAPRDPAWTADGMVSQRWLPVSPVTGRIDAFEWKVPVERLSPAIDYVPEPIEEAPVIELKPVIATPAIITAPAPRPVLALVPDSATQNAALAPIGMVPDDPGVKEGTAATPSKRFKLF